LEERVIVVDDVLLLDAPFALPWTRSIHLVDRPDPICALIDRGIANPDSRRLRWEESPDRE
jgi:hypothetical protein